VAEHNITGNKGEKMAQEFLFEMGYEILACNWRFQKAEIDIIAKIDNQIIFVEVKTRSTSSWIEPKDAVTLNKQRLIIKAANAFLEEENIDLDCRFDIISVRLDKAKVEIEQLKDAFNPMI